MSDDEIVTMVRDSCVRILKVPPERVRPDTRLREDLEADSLHLAELHVSMEEVWGPMPREALATLRTVGDVVAYARELATANAR
ncbi:acyl carrier protein [Nonomuraea candida]|uniref:acyl carrier protein n=1 Tax=Nonomuraea candida TaxID=359159 RepID=UPI0005BC4049|nr:acyl carrier protein [Nonomuraea candida]